MSVRCEHLAPRRGPSRLREFTQLAQFSALQAQTNLSTQFASFQSNFGVMQAAGDFQKLIAEVRDQLINESAGKIRGVAA